MANTVTKFLFLALTLLMVLIKQGLAHESWALAFELPDNDKMCFFQDFKEAKKMILTYEVVSGGKFDVDVAVESPNGNQIYKEVKKTQGEFGFETSWGVFSFCFSNEFSTFTHKVVYFELRPHDHDTLAHEAGKKKPSVDTQVEHSMEQVHFLGTNIVEIQKEYRLDEIRGHNLAEELNSRVQWWSFGQACIIVMVGFGQVIMLKTLFSGTLPNQVGGRAKSTPLLLTP